MRYPMGVQVGDNPPEGGPRPLPRPPGSSVSHPSGAQRGRRPRLGGGLFSLPQVATGIDVETGTAPPHGRGPLFASQRTLPEPSSSWARRPRMRGGLCSLPQAAAFADFGKDAAPPDSAPGKPQGFSPQLLSGHSAPRRMFRTQRRLGDGPRRDELGTTRHVLPARLRAVHRGTGCHHSAPRLRRLRERRYDA